MLSLWKVFRSDSNEIRKLLLGLIIIIKYFILILLTVKMTHFQVLINLSKLYPQVKDLYVYRKIEITLTKM